MIPVSDSSIRLTISAKRSCAAVADLRSRLTIEPITSATTGRKITEKIVSFHEIITNAIRKPTIMNGSRNATSSVLVMQNCTTCTSDEIFEMMSPLRSLLK